VPLTLQFTLDGDLTAARSDEDDRAQWRNTALIVSTIRSCGWSSWGMARSPQGSLVEDAREGLSAEFSASSAASTGWWSHWTAVVALFHDHDWEAPLAPGPGTAPVFVGAIGSMRTHLERQRRLLESGAISGDTARVIGPVGLIKATRDP
jgi:xanthine dehydrogenase accessory factor